MPYQRGSITPADHRRRNRLGATRVDFQRGEKTDVIISDSTPGLTVCPGACAREGLISSSKR